MKFDCWEASQEVQDWFASQGLTGTEADLFDLWVQFERNATEKLVEANDGEKKDVIVWTSSLTDLGETGDKFVNVYKS